MKWSIRYAEYAAAFGHRHLATFGPLRVAIWVVRRHRAHTPRSRLRRLIVSALSHWRRDYDTWRAHA